MTAISTGITFQRESITETWDEALGLMAANNLETGALPMEDFHPDKATYLQFEVLGIARLFTVRDDGKLVGYGLFMVSKGHPHYPGVTFARQDVLYIAPDHRGLNSLKFMDWTDICLASEGVKRILRHVTRKVDYSRALEHLGYEEIERTFMREI